MPSRPGFNPKVRYSPIDEVAAKSGTSVLEIIHAAAHGDFPVYVLADNWKVSAFTMDQESGTWMPASPKPSSYTGPVRLYPRDLMRLEANPSAEITELMGDTAGYVGYEPDEEWQYRLMDGPISLNKCMLVMMAKDLNPLRKATAKQKAQVTPPAMQVDSEVTPVLGKAGTGHQIVDLSTLPNDHYLRISDLAKKVLPISSASIWRKVKEGSFPTPTKISKGITAWRVEDIREWLECNK